MIHRSVGFFGSWMALAVVLLTAPAQGAAPAEKLLPPGVLAYASCPNVEELKERFSHSSFGELLNDKALDDFRAEISGAMSAAANGISEELGIPLEDLLALPSGTVTLAAIRPVGQSLGYVAIFDAGSHGETLEQLLTKIEEELAARDAERQTETFDDVEIVQYTLAGLEEGDEPMTFAYFVQDSVLVLGSSPALLESVITRWDGAHSSTFADNEVYAYIRQQCQTNERSRPVVTWYVNPVELTTSILAMNEQMAMQSVMLSAYLPTLGLNRLKAMGGAIEMGTPEFSSVSRTFIYIDPPATGVLKMFEFPATITGPPAWVPADASQYMGMHWDLPGAYGAVESIYDTFTGQPGAFEKMVSNLSRQPGAPELHPKRDVVEVLTGQVQMYFNAPEPSEVTQLNGIIAIGVADDERARDTLLQVIESTQGAAPEPMSMHGTDVYALDGSDFSMAIKGGYIYFATNADLLAGPLAGTAPATGSLTGSPEFQAIAAQLPKESSILAFQRQDDQYEALYEMLRSGQLDSIFEGNLDFGKLPPFEQIRKHFRPTASYSIPDAQGALMVNFELAHD